MTFLDWLADELKKTDVKDLEIGFDTYHNVDELIDKQNPLK